METVKKNSCLADRINSGGRCEATVASRTRLRWIKLRKCQDLPCRTKYPFKIKGSVKKNYVRSAMLIGSETWCLGLNEIQIWQRTERTMVRSMCGVKIVDKNSTKDLMQMLDLSEAMDQMSNANSVRWHGNYVLRMDKHNFLRRALDFKVEGDNEKRQTKRKPG